MGDESSVWVQSTLNVKTRSYAVELVVNDTTARIMGRLEAVEYAAALYAVAARAEYDAAVYRQITTRLELQDDAAGQVIADLRDERAPIRESHTAPVVYTPGVSGFDGRPFVHCVVTGHQAWQWSPAEARQHAGHVMDLAAAVDYDSGYLQVLTTLVDIPFPRATAVVNDLANHRTTEGDQS